MMSNFQNLNLHPTIVSTLEKKGYLEPTPIQAQAIPHLLEGKDLLGIAQTGTGKTAAFALPILNFLFHNKHQVKPNQIRSLILTPTRELATQIAENIGIYGDKLGLKHAVIFGGVSEVNQIKELKNGLDIVIATPGRLLDLANQGHIRFSQVEIFVLDEADRMLDMGFINDVRKIISKLPAERQSLLFSATMPDTISRLANSILKNPIKVEITPQSTTVERINQKVYLVEKSNKPALLLDVLTKTDVAAALVFCKTKHGADKVVSYLEKYAVSVLAIHGNKSQSAREKALKNLRDGKIKVLIATDIAARGIDVSSISHVINYDIPIDPESYVHRIGRTARAGREGIAISFCEPLENLLLRAVEKAIRMKIPVDTSHPFHGKASTHDSSEGRLLSRRLGDKNVDKRKSGGESNVGRDRPLRSKISGSRLDSRSDSRPSSRSDSRSDSGREDRSSRFQTSDSRSDSRDTKNRSFSKQRRPGRPGFGADGASENREPVVKKILRKFGFNKFGKSSDGEGAKGAVRNYSEGAKNRSKSPYSKSSDSKPSGSKPFRSKSSFFSRGKSSNKNSKSSY